MDWEIILDLTNKLDEIFGRKNCLDKYSPTEHTHEEYVTKEELNEIWN